MDEVRDPHGWMWTYSGKRYWPMDPRPEDICIEDLAHGLSMQCRYAGQTRHFYCVTPETKILTEELEWVQAGDITTGQRLWGFDDQCGEQGHRVLQKWRPSVARVHGKILRNVIEITLSDGTKLRCSEEHPLLSCTKLAGNRSWLTAKTILDRYSNGVYRHPNATTYLPKFIDTWSRDLSYRSGWLAGMFDGEGHLSSKQSRGAIVAIGQNPGPTFDAIKTALRSFGIRFSESRSGVYRCRSLVVNGGIEEQLRLLGTIRPQRLLSKMIVRMAGRDFIKKELVEVVGARRLGLSEVVALETSTHTYITEGFGSHNSVAEHSVHVSLMVPPELALEGLLHDATEAYLSDVVRPFKKGLLDYKHWERKNDECVRERFRLPLTEHPLVKQADSNILHTEYKTLMRPLPAEYAAQIPGVYDPTVRLYLWSPAAAEIAFLNRYRALRRGDATC